MKKGWIETVLKHIYLILTAAVSLIPFIWVLITSLKSPDEIFNPSAIFPSRLFLDNFHGVLIRASFSTYFLNSTLVSVVTTLICILFSVMAAYGFVRFRIIGSRRILLSMLFTQMFPAILLALPYYILLKNLNLTNNLGGLILVYTSFILPFCVWNIKGVFAQLPWDLEEAAFIDGCNRFQVIMRIILPIARPGIAATALFAFIRSWDEFMYANTFITTKDKRTVQIGLQSFVGEYTTDWGLMMAGAVITCIPILVFFGFVQKNIVQGLTAGSVKG